VEATVDVAAWLKNLGLGQYETAFRDNGIGEAVLPHLTVEDLKEIGVATVGDRRMLLAAIAALASPTSSDATSPQRSPARPKKDPELSAERRPITVLFCDLVGSTTIAAALDAEDWRNLVSAYLDAASAAVTQMGGRVAKKLGDGLMALFGHPIAQENDSERAVRAALMIQRALAELNRENAGSRRPELVARIGIESGAVVVDTAGEIFGDAPNIAARVQALAEPGAVLITGRVQRQVAGRRRGSGRAGAERRARADDALSDCARKRRPALRRPRAHSPRRARGGARRFGSLLGAGGGRRRPARAPGR
jgi:class 3 adenylate cyclase